MVDAVLLKSGHEWFGDVLLADDVGEGLGAITTVKCGTHKQPIQLAGKNAGARCSSLPICAEVWAGCAVSVGSQFLGLGASSRLAPEVPSGRWELGSNLGIRE